MEPQLDPLVVEFFAGLPQQGPGSDGDSAAALAVIQSKLPRAPAVADLGCGTGRSTLFLAEQLKTGIVAVELEPLFCERLARDAAARHLVIDVRQGHMADPPIQAASLDLVWSEGAAYLIGFAEALRRWRALLKPGGFCVVSECTWLKADPPPDIARFFAEGYPDMADIPSNVGRACAAGYELVTTQILLGEAWARYYGPIRRALRERKVAGALARELETELGLFDRSAGSYGYVFYVLRRSSA
jgi:SAM-dependent methyltransferase